MYVCLYNMQFYILPRLPYPLSRALSLSLFLSETARGTYSVSADGQKALTSSVFIIPRCYA